MHDIGETQFLELFGGITQHPLEGGIHVEEPAVLIDENAVMGHFHHGLEDGLGDLFRLQVCRVMGVHMFRENTRCATVYQQSIMGSARP